MDRDEFFLAACQPTFGDKMAFQMRSADHTPGTTFSIEGLENLTDQMFGFMLARAHSRMTQGLPAKELHMLLSMNWHSFEHELLEIGPPWYAVEDKAVGLQVIDSRHRWLRERP